MITQCINGSGYLVIFDLSGGASMSTSINCAMELAMLYQLFRSGTSGLKVVVLNDKDVYAPDLAGLIWEKSNRQGAQAELFKKAHDSCYNFLHSLAATTNGLHEVSHLWERDYQAAGGEHQGMRRVSMALGAAQEASTGTDIFDMKGNGATNRGGMHVDTINPVFAHSAKRHLAVQTAARNYTVTAAV